jgi:integrase
VLAERAAEVFNNCGDAGRAVAERLAVSPSPGSSLIWIEKSRTAKILIDLLRHGREPAHEDLDALPSMKRADGKADRRQSIENARMILVSIGVLASRNALAGRYEAWALQVLAKVDQAADRWTLQQFHRHRLLPSVEARCETGKATRGTVRQVQNQLRAAIELMAWSRPRGGLGGLSRSDVDEWLAGPSTRHWARQFLLWAIRQHLLDLPASAIPLRTPQAPPDVEDYQLRADLAHRLLHEEGIPVDIRVAGLLVVLYGQHLSRIASIERENVDLESTPPRIKLGKNWLELPDPMGRHITELLAQGPRRNAPFIENARWLFLPKTLARLLDLQTGTAVSWVNKAGGIYSNYWGQVLRDEEAEDPGLFDPGLEALEEDEDPEDLLDELGLI